MDRAINTIATHNGTQVSQYHNIRDRKYCEKQEHIDPNGHYEIWRHEMAKDAYERIFGDAVKEYNEKQTREDRKIEDYYQKIVDDKTKNPVYEMIIGVYSNATKEEEREIMKEFVDGWKDRNPNLILIGAYYHNDEDGHHHVHCDYIPIKHDCARGLSIQNGLNGALKEQGFFTSGINHTAQMHWEKRENEVLERLCRDRGIEIEHPQSKEHAKEKSIHLDKELYIVQQKEQELEERKKDLIRDIKDYNEKADYVNKAYYEIEKVEDYLEKVEKYCDRVDMSINDYYTNEFWADRDIRQHLPPEIYNPSREEQEREEIRAYYERDEKDHDRDR